MHANALQWVARFATGDPCRVLDIGGRNINGSPRHLFGSAEVYRTLDIAPGEGVDVVADAATWEPDGVYDVVVCCEVFEHTDVWPEICRTAYAAVRRGGSFIVTCAGPGRAVHSGVDGRHRLLPGEHYANVEPDDMRAALEAAGWTVVELDQSGEDVRAYCTKDAA